MPHPDQKSILLLAAGEVGVRIAGLLTDRGVAFQTLVSPDDPERRNADIVALTKAPLIEPGRPLAEQLEDPDNIDLTILAWWPHLLKKPDLDLAKAGCLNFHPSLLPYCRGKHPNFWAIAKKEPFGVTLHFIDEAIDAGEIAYQREIPITWEDNGESLYKKGREAIVSLFEENFREIVSGKIPRRRAIDTGSLHFAREIEEASKIDLAQAYPARDFLNLLRARTFEGHPACWFEADGCQYEVQVSIQKKKP